MTGSESGGQVESRNLQYALHSARFTFTLTLTEPYTIAFVSDPHIFPKAPQ